MDIVHGIGSYRKSRNVRPSQTPSSDGSLPRFDLDANFAGSVGRFGTFRCNGSPGAFGGLTSIIENFELVGNGASTNGIAIRHSDTTQARSPDFAILGKHHANYLSRNAISALITTS